MYWFIWGKMLNCGTLLCHPKKHPPKQDPPRPPRTPPTPQNRGSGTRIGRGLGAGFFKKWLRDDPPKVKAFDKEARGDPWGGPPGGSTRWRNMLRVGRSIFLGSVIQHFPLIAWKSGDGVKIPVATLLSNISNYI